MAYHVPNTTVPKPRIRRRTWSLVLWTSLLAIPLLVNGLAMIVDAFRGSNPFNGFSRYEVIALGLVTIAFITNSSIVVHAIALPTRWQRLKRWLLIGSFVVMIIALWVYFAYVPLFAV